MSGILVTGGTGTFGRAFVRSAIDVGVSYRICIYSRDEHKQADMRGAFPDSRLRFFIGDVRDRDRLRTAMRGCDIVVHAAALKRIETSHYNPIEVVKTNVLGAVNVIEASVDAGVQRVIALSTDKAYQPVSAYGHSKAMAECLFLAANEMHGVHGPRFAVCRYGNIAGANGSVIPKWRRLLEEGREISVTDPDATRFWMTSSEAVDFVLSTLEAMPREVAIPDLPAYRLGDLAEAMGVPGFPVITGLPAWEKKHECMEEGKCSNSAPRLSVEELKELLKDV